MPMLRFNGLDATKVQTLSKKLSQPLSEAIGCPTNWLYYTNISSDDSAIFCNGNEVTNEVYVHVEWFDRGQEIKDQVAKIITEMIQDNSVISCPDSMDVTVIFIELEKSSYYENGEHY